MSHGRIRTFAWRVAIFIPLLVGTAVAIALVYLFTPRDAE